MSHWYRLKKARASEAMTTVRVVEQGKLFNGFDIQWECERAMRQTQFIGNDIPLTFSRQHPCPKLPDGQKTIVEITDERTVTASYRLVVTEQRSNVCIFNFASPISPAGGFLNGAMAQEESIAHCSNLLQVLSQPQLTPFYTTQPAPYYTSHVIYTKELVMFRNEASKEELDSPYYVDCLTCAAPNATEILKLSEELAEQQKKFLEQLNPCMAKRIAVILDRMVAMGCKTLILGAFGCGVFGNNPDYVADYFHQYLTLPKFENVFEKVVFAMGSRDDACAKAFFSSRLAELCIKE